MKAAAGLPLRNAAVLSRLECHGTAGIASLLVLP